MVGTVALAPISATANKNSGAEASIESNPLGLTFRRSLRGIPVVFDSHHHELGPQDTDYHDAFYLARQTWHARDAKQQCHHSNSRKNYEDGTVSRVAHSDWYYTPFENYGEDVDVVLECKKKELALFDYLTKFTNTKTGTKDEKRINFIMLNSMRRTKERRSAS